MRRNKYADLFVVKLAFIVEDNLSDRLCDLERENDDIFLAKLPDGLPLACAVQFDALIKPDAIPILRSPFRLSKTEQ